MISADAFAETVRRLELGLESPERAHGRWRKQEVILEASGQLRMALLAEFGEQTPEERLPPPLATSVPELGIRSESPTHLLGILDRPEFRGRVFSLLGSVRSVEVRDADIAFQLEQLTDLPALKHTLDRAVEWVEAVREALANTPRLPLLAPSSEEGPHISAEIRARAVERNRKIRGGMRNLAILVGGLGLGTVFLWRLGHPGTAVFCAIFGSIVPAMYFIQLGDLGALACPRCGAYLSLFFAQERCRRCDLQLK